MQKEKTSFTTIEEYILMFPPDIQTTLRQLREVIHEAAPQAEEKISYQMPTFYQNGNLVHFAANKNHIGFYPAPSGVLSFADALTGYKTSKGAIRFPTGKPLPFDLIRRIVHFRVEENTSSNKKFGGTQ
jgi:uncharacterized protein YdhG (YjbR/CyaY superfamily)